MSIFAHKRNFYLLLFCLFYLLSCGVGVRPHSSASVTALIVSPNTPTVSLGYTKQFSAHAVYLDGTIESITPTWALSPGTGNASVNSSGLVSTLGGSTGSVTVTATFGGISKSETLTITSAILLSMEVTPAQRAVGLANSQQYTATGTFSDNSTSDITNSVTWSRTNGTGAASINGTGLLLTSSIGSVTVTATSGAIAASTSVTVDYSFPDNASNTGWFDMTNNVLLHHMEDASGMILDTSGNSNHGTATAITYNIPGQLGFGFQGINNTTKIEVPTSAGLEMGTGSFSISFWFYFDGTNQLGFPLIKSNDGVPDYEQFNFMIGDGNVYTPSIGKKLAYFVRDTNGSTDRSVVSGDLAAGWHHVVGTINTTNAMNLYIDNVHIGTAPNGSAGNVNASNGNLFIGRSMIGSMDELAIWKGRVLSAGEVNTIYTNQQ